MNGTPNASVLSCLVTAGLMISTRAALGAEAPEEWLERMTGAFDNVSYAGTVIRTRGSESEPLKVLRTIVDGVINEKVTVQEGSGLEIIREGDEVHCILPDKKRVLVESWDDKSTLFSSLPSGDVGFSNEYDLSLVREERVAGRKTVLLAIRPHDQFRYSHRLWLDRETAFPLRAELIDRDGSILEQIKFADIDLASEVSAADLTPSVSIENFTWVETAPKRIEADIETDWLCDDLPPGFRVVATKTEQLPGTENPVTHIVYSDGLATVSVFISDNRKKPMARRSNIGGSHAYSLQQDTFQITAVGAVPAETVQRIAVSMRRR